MALLESFQRREHEPADRGEIVAAFLYDDIGSPGWPISARPRESPPS